MLKKAKRCFSVINYNSFAIEPEDLVNAAHRKEDLKLHYTTEGGRPVTGKATTEGFKYFRSRNLESKLTSTRRELQQARLNAGEPRGIKPGHRDAKRGADR